MCTPLRQSYRLEPCARKARVPAGRHDLIGPSRLGKNSRWKQLALSAMGGLFSIPDAVTIAAVTESSDRLRINPKVG
jgi:hypothetical protein